MEGTEEVAAGKDEVGGGRVYFPHRWPVGYVVRLCSAYNSRCSSFSRYVWITKSSSVRLVAGGIRSRGRQLRRRESKALFGETWDRRVAGFAQRQQPSDSHHRTGFKAQLLAASTERAVSVFDAARGH